MIPNEQRHHHLRGMSGFAAWYHVSYRQGSKTANLFPGCEPTLALTLFFAQGESE
jgi:hypothetical protein